MRWALNDTSFAEILLRVAGVRAPVRTSEIVGVKWGFTLVVRGHCFDVGVKI